MKDTPRTVEAMRQLEAYHQQLELLLYLTPINTHKVWNRFQRQTEPLPPVFLYAPQNPKLDELLADVEAITFPDASPDLQAVLVDHQEWVSQRIRLAMMRHTPDMLAINEAIFGRVPERLHQQAVDILRALPPRVRGEQSTQRVDAHAIKARAQEEIDHYRAQWPGFQASIQLRDTITGILVSKGNLVIGQTYTTPTWRVVPLLQHEIGTHSLCYANGREQPIPLLAQGLARYESLQEGLAVLAEYLCDGLSKPRLRLLAGRVVAAKSVEQHAEWLDTYYLLKKEYGFPKRLAFNITTRVHRSGAYTKDFVYLQGLTTLLEYIQEGHDITPLYAGRFAFSHINWVTQKLANGELTPPRLLPRLLTTDAQQARLRALRQPIALTKLVSSHTRKPTS